MLEFQDTALPSVVQAARKMVGDVDALAGSLIEQHELLRERLDHLQREHQELRRTEVDLRREKDEMAATLAEVRATHQSLVNAYEARSQALQELGDQFDAFLRRLKDGRDTEVRGDSAPER